MKHSSEAERINLREAVDALLEEGYVFWDEMGLKPLSSGMRYDVVDAAGIAYDGVYLTQFAAACQSFFLFRELHRGVCDTENEDYAKDYTEDYTSETKFADGADCADDKEVNTLLGDYFFSSFSHNLIPIDSVPLIDAFSEYLAKDASGKAMDYQDFIEKLPEVMAS